MPSFSAPSTRRMLTIAPVPISALPKPTSSPPCSFAVRASGSSDITLRPVQQLDLVLLVPGGRVDVGVLAGRLAAQVLLRERRPFVGRLRLAADQQDRALGARACAARRRSGDDAMPPPIRRKSTSRSATAAPTRPGVSRRRLGAVAAARPEDLFQLVLLARVEHGEDLVADLEHGVGPGHEALALAQDRDQQAAVGHREVADPAAGDAAVLAEQHLDDLELLLLQVEQVDQPVLGHLVLEQAQDQVGGRDRGLDPEQVEVGLVARVVDPGDDPLDHVLLFGDLADQHVVLVVAGHRDHHVGALDAGPLEHPELGGVAVGDVVLELLLDRQVAAAVALDHRHLVLLFEQLAGQVPADLAGADDDDVHGLRRLLGAVGAARRRGLSLAHGGLEHVDRDPGRADRAAGPAAGTTRPAAGRGCGRSRSAPRSGAGRSGR